MACGEQSAADAGSARRNPPIVGADRQRAFGARRAGGSDRSSLAYGARAGDRADRAYGRSRHADAAARAGRFAEPAGQRGGAAQRRIDPGKAGTGSVRHHRREERVRPARRCAGAASLYRPARAVSGGVCEGHGLNGSCGAGAGGSRREWGGFGARALFDAGNGRDRARHGFLGRADERGAGAWRRREPCGGGAGGALVSFRRAAGGCPPYHRRGAARRRRRTGGSGQEHHAVRRARSLGARGLSRSRGGAVRESRRGSRGIFRHRLSHLGVLGLRLAGRARGIGFSRHFGDRRGRNGFLEAIGALHRRGRAGRRENRSRWRSRAIAADPGGGGVPGRRGAGRLRRAGGRSPARGGLAAPGVAGFGAASDQRGA